MDKFKVGDVVSLKSGIGPIMTVERLGVGIDGKDVKCVWFNVVENAAVAAIDSIDAWDGPIRDIFPSEALAVLSDDEEEE